MKNFVFGAALCALMGTISANAQAVAGAAVTPSATLLPAAPTAPLVVATGPAAHGSVLRTGAPVTLKMSETISTKGKKLEAGYLAHLEVLDPVLVDGVVVIPAGSPAIAEVTDVRNKGMWGKSGKINARMLYVTVGTGKSACVVCSTTRV